MKLVKIEMPTSLEKARGFTLVEIMIVVLIIGILLAIAVPNFIQARESARAKACIANLKQIDSAKQQWLMDKSKTTFTSYAPSAGDGILIGTYIRSLPICPSNGTYTSQSTFVLPTCTLGTNVVNGVSYPHVIN